MRVPSHLSSWIRPERLLLFLLSACLLYAAAFILYPPVVRFALADSRQLVLWREILIFRGRWPLIGIGIVLSLLALSGYMRVRSGSVAGTGATRQIAVLRCLMPLAILPATGVVLLLGDFLSIHIVSNVILFVPALVVSLILLAALDKSVSSNGGQGPKQNIGGLRSVATGVDGATPSKTFSTEVRHLSPERSDADADGTDRRWPLVIFLVSTLSYTSIGYSIALVAGEHVGDEAHYLTQAKSLYFDHDLDIKNNLVEQDGKHLSNAEIEASLKKLASKRSIESTWDLMRYVHVAESSRNGRWYSTHPFGLSILLFLFWPLGMFVRYLVLGILGALGNVAMYRIARGLGVGRNAAAITVFSFGATLYWAIYSGRALPEVLGATLLCWTFWAVLRQEQRPWLTVVVGSLCCGYLPMVHERFIPLSLLGFGFYGLFGLFSAGKWARRIVRLATFSILTFVGYGAYVASQWLMYEKGLKYSVGGGLFSYPLGMWGVIADWRGVMPVLPSFVWLVAAFIVYLLRRELCTRNRLFAVAIGITFLANLLFSCSNHIYPGGSCIPGRYVVAVVPLLVCSAAYVFQETNSVGRWWFLFLNLVSTAFLVMVLLLLPILGREFIFPAATLSSCHPVLGYLFYPHASFFRCPPWLMAQTATTLYVVAGIALTILILTISQEARRRALVPLLIIFVIAAWSHSVAHDYSSEALAGERTRFPLFLKRIHFDRVYVPTKLDKPTDLFDVFKLTFSDLTTATVPVGVTTSNLGARMVGRMVSQPKLEVNDWDGRGFCWMTLTAPFKPAPGAQILHMEATLDGNATPVFVLRQGSRTLFEGPLAVNNGMIEENFGFRCKRYAGNLYILVRLADGEGTFTLKDMYWTPYGEGLVKDTNIVLPGNLRIISK